jgi:hypothetical protein
LRGNDVDLAAVFLLQSLENGQEQRVKDVEDTLKLPFADGIKMLKEAGAKNLDGSELSESDDLR